MAGTTPVLYVRSFSVLGRSGIERVGTVWLTGDFFGIIRFQIFLLILISRKRSVLRLGCEGVESQYRSVVWEEKKEE